MELSRILETGFSRLDNRLAQMDNRLAQMDNRLVQMDNRLARLGLETGTSIQRHGASVEARAFASKFVFFALSSHSLAAPY